MARSFYRTLAITSLLAAVGSFIVDLGALIIEIAAFAGIKIHHLGMLDRGLAIVVCVSIIAFSTGGLIVIQLLKGRRN